MKKRNRSWLAGAMLLLPLLNGYGDTLAANYRRDYRVREPLVSGWHYLWNAPDGWMPTGESGNMWVGRMGHPTSYRPLVAAGGTWTADGDNDGENHVPDRYVSLNATGGHPGGGINVYRNYEGRFAIAAYTVSEAGRYVLEGASLSLGSSEAGDGIHLMIHVNDQQPVLEKMVPPGETVSFGVALGDLSAGDTIYVGVGPKIKLYSDGFQWDFSIVWKNEK